ncbi:MAG TPA: anti-sigma factor [Longimicrobiales bacterium]|nr:anti-sigma factor [Longimicrobiales bacterium]
MSDSMDCSDIDELVDAWLDDALPPLERQGFDAHLATCEACRTTALEQHCTRQRSPGPPDFPMPALMKRRLVQELRELGQHHA